MQILPVSNNNLNFNGNVRTVGYWPKTMKEAFESSEIMKNFANGYDVVGRIKTKTLKGAAYQGEKIYKIYVSLVETGNKFEKFLDDLHLLPRRSLTTHKHREAGMISRIDEEHANYLKKQFGL